MISVLLSSLVLTCLKGFCKLQVEEKGYRRLTKGQAVGLRYAGLIISLKDVKKDANGQVVEVMCTTSATCTEKPKAYIHWVSNPMFVEVRLYELL